MEKFKHSQRPVWRAIMVFAAAAAIVTSGWQMTSLAAERLSDEQVAALVPQLFRLHLRQHDMDTGFTRRVLKEFVNQLDPTKSFYLKSEGDALVNLTDAELLKLGRQTQHGDFSRFRTMLKDFLDTQIARDAKLYDGLEGRLAEVKEMLKAESDKLAASVEKENKAPQPGTNPNEVKTVAANDPDTEEEDRLKWTERPADHKEREIRLLRFVGMLFNSNRNYLSENDAFKLALQTAREERAKWVKINMDEEVAKLFLKSFMDAMDPHTDYFDADDDEFTDRLERSFAGIGVQIRPCPLGAQIEDIIKGGPSEKSGKFTRGDQIVAVDSFALAGLPINKIVKKIKGERGTEVKLSVLKRETKKTEEITIKRDIIELSEMRVKGKKIDTAAGPVGVISVQTFYRGVHKDVRDRIRELSKDKPLTGLVLDLRDNHGGYLEEAVGLAGLFIDSGSVVGEKDGDGRIDWKDDTDGVTAYSGPLVVLTNQFSASASEIVAGSLKDYNRGLIVGATQTFGKGTVQRVIPLATLNLPGEIKITTHQYFLASGSSVQMKGVDSDVQIPGPKLYEDMLERANENAIPWNKIDGKINTKDTNYIAWTEWKGKNLDSLRAKSKERMEKNQEIKDFFDIKKRRAKLLAEQKEWELKRSKNPDEPPPVADKKDEKDPQAEEAAAIAADMAVTWPDMAKRAAK